MKFLKLAILNMFIENEDNGFIDFLIFRLKNELPGMEAQKKMAPDAGGKFPRSFIPTESAKKSAVMALFHILNNELCLLFTLRSQNISHSGQISFPGGRMEPGEIAQITAKRETYEETGINPDEIRIIGNLSNLYVQPSDSFITPVIGFIDKLPEIKSNEYEVEEVFSVSFDKFTGDKHFKSEIWKFNEMDVTVPFWDVHSTTPLWGATAMILMELVTLFQEYKFSINSPLL